MNIKLPELPKTIKPDDVFVRIIGHEVDPEDGKIYYNGIYIDCEGRNVLDTPLTQEDKVLELEKKLEEMRLLLKQQMDDIAIQNATASSKETKETK